MQNQSDFSVIFQASTLVCHSYATYVMHLG